MMDYTHGKQDDTDPEFLVDTTTNEDIAGWLSDLLAMPAGALDPWSTRFVKSVEMTFEAKMESGYDEHPLTGKQLANLKRLWKELAQKTVQGVKDMRRQVAGSTR